MKYILIISILSLLSYPLNAMRPEDRNQECIICLSTVEELDPGQALLTACCSQFICRNDAEQIEQRTAEEHARCPICRNYQLRTIPMPQGIRIETPQQQECHIQEAPQLQEAVLARQRTQQEAAARMQAEQRVREEQERLEQARCEEIVLRQQEAVARAQAERQRRGRGRVRGRALPQILYPGQEMLQLGQGAYIARVELSNLDPLAYMNPNKWIKILVCFNQEINMQMYTDFVRFLNQLCHEHRPRGSTEVRRCHQARRIIYHTNMDPNIFQELLNQANQHFFE